VKPIIITARPLGSDRPITALTLQQPGENVKWDVIHFQATGSAGLAKQVAHSIQTALCREQ